MIRVVRKTALVALVWLTAASTVLAGLPRFECVCPGGRGLPRPGMVAKSGGCCCGGSCCAGGAANPQPQGQSCCGQPQGEKPRPPAKESGHRHGARATPAEKAGPGSSELHRPACAKTPVPSEAFTFTSTGPSQAQLPPLDLSIVLTPGLVPALLAAGPLAQLSWLVNSVPPPTDRVIVLQHFLI